MENKTKFNDLATYLIEAKKYYENENHPGLSDKTKEIVINELRSIAMLFCSAETLRKMQND